MPQDDVCIQNSRCEKRSHTGRTWFAADVSKADRLQRVDEVLAELDLTHRRDLLISRLSGGQRKRVSVGIELLTRPSLLVLDEPTSGLDPGLERGVMELLRQLADTGRTVIVVTHSVQSLGLCGPRPRHGAGRRDGVPRLAATGARVLRSPRLPRGYFRKSSGVVMFTRTSVHCAERIVATSSSHALLCFSAQVAPGYVASRRLRISLTRSGARGL